MHKIGNISFQVEMQENNTAFSYEKQYATFMEYQFLPKVAQLFDKWSAAYPKLKCTIEEILLDINVETFDAQELQKKLLQQLTNQLAKINVTNPEKSENIKAEISIKASVFDAFISYLKTGILPNYISVKQIKEWLKKELKFTTRQIKIIQHHATSDFLFLKRLANVYYDKKYDKLVKILGQETLAHTLEPFVKELVKVLQKSFYVKITEVQIRKWYKQQNTIKSITEISESMLTLLQEKEVIKTLNHVEKEQFSLHIMQAFLQYESTTEITVDFIKDLMFKPIVKSKIEEEQNQKTKLEVDKNKTEEVLFEEKQKIKIEEEQKTALLKEKQVQKEQQEKVKTAKRKSKSKEVKRKKEQEIQQKEKDIQTKNVKIITEKGGLVLLHPFIKELFKAMDLLTEKNKINRANKAVLILHYLATGNQEVLDLELSLEKILLGIPLTEVITINKKLTESEKQQCNELLSAVIKHWKIYKSNAINSLRAMFLQRFASITQTETKINIEIEKQAQDLLLDKLPWGIGMIKLPWLNQLIYTKW